MTARTQMETAVGGVMLGMSMPLVAFGGGLAFGSADLLGLSAEPLALPFGALLVLAALLLASAGSTLLWWSEPLAAAPRLPARPRARRREVPVARAPVRTPEPSVSIITVTADFQGEDAPTASMVAAKPLRSLAEDLTASLVTLTPVAPVAPVPSVSLGGEPTTRLVAFAGTQRRVRFNAGV